MGPAAALTVTLIVLGVGFAVAAYWQKLPLRRRIQERGCNPCPLILHWISGESCPYPVIYTLETLRDMKRTNASGHFRLSVRVSERAGGSRQARLHHGTGTGQNGQEFSLFIQA